MPHRLRHLLYHPLTLGSLIMVIGSNVNNIIQYLYHPVMGRLLDIALYGEMSASFSLIVLLGVIPSSLSLVVVKYVSGTTSEEEISNFLTWIHQKAFIVGVIASGITAIFSPFIAAFLNISSPFTVVLVGIAMIFTLPLIVVRSALTGLTKFKEYITSIILESSAKLVMGSLLVMAGFSIHGALAGVVIAGIVGWSFSRLSLKGLIGRTPGKRPQIKPLVIYALPVVVNSLASTSLFSTDLILAKHFLPATQAGVYAALSALGKIVIFGSGPVAGVMFPLVSKRISAGFTYHRIFSLGLLLTILACAAILIIYKVFPALAVTSLFGAKFIPVVPYLFLFGIAVSLIAISSYLVNFLLSVNRTHVVIFPALAAISQAIGIWIYHSDIFAFIAVSTWVSVALLTLLVVDTIVHFKTNYIWHR